MRILLHCLYPLPNWKFCGWDKIKIYKKNWCSFFNDFCISFLQPNQPKVKKVKINLLKCFDMNCDALVEFPLDTFAQFSINQWIVFLAIKLQIIFDHFYQNVEMITNSANIIATAHKIRDNWNCAKNIWYSSVELKEPHQIPSPKSLCIEWHHEIEGQ